MAGTVQVETSEDGLVRVFTLHNPSKRNALDPPLCEALIDAISALPRDAVRAAVITGDGDKAFCSGFDLDALPAGADAAQLAENVFETLLSALADCPVPLVAALNGVAFGGGCELAAACDLRVAHDAVKLGMPPARLGIVYAARGLARFSAIVGESRARRIFLWAHTASAHEARDWGLVDELVPASDVCSRAIALASEAASLAPLAVQGMRRTFERLLAQRAALPPLIAQDLDARRLDAWRSSDAAEARLAFSEKRPARFRGE